MIIHLHYIRFAVTFGSLNHAVVVADLCQSNPAFA